MNDAAARARTLPSPPPSVAAPRAPTLFQSLLGPAFFRLPEPVRRLHAAGGTTRYLGKATVERGTHPLARLCARLARLPPSMREAPLTVEFDASPTGETWRRTFDGVPMRSTLRVRDGLLHERLGGLHLRFHLYLHDAALHWRVAGARLLGIVPLPARWFDGVHCIERDEDGRYAFDIVATLPLAGKVIRYCGWLEPEA